MKLRDTGHDSESERLAQRMAKLEEKLFGAMERIAQLEVENARLHEENNRLHEENSRLQQQLAAARKNSSTSSKPPSSNMVTTYPRSVVGQNGQDGSKRLNGGIGLDADEYRGACTAIEYLDLPIPLLSADRYGKIRKLAGWSSRWPKKAEN